MSAEKVNTLIVGGGQAGLAMSRHLGDAGVDHLMGEARMRDRIAVEEETCIDVTAGTSILSIAAATFTFNRDMRIVYVGSGKSDSDKFYVMKTDLEIGAVQEA